MTFHFSGKLSLVEKPPCCYVCALYEDALMTQEIVRSKDAQCNTEESS